MKGNPVGGGITGPPCSWGGHKYGDLAVQIEGSLESETVEYENSDPRLTALASTSRKCKMQTRPLVREGTPHQQTHKCLTVIKSGHGP
jgi:hypothetical protein